MVTARAIPVVLLLAGGSVDVPVKQNVKVRLKRTDAGTGTRVEVEVEVKHCFLTIITTIILA